MNRIAQQGDGPSTGDADDIWCPWLTDLGVQCVDVNVLELHWGEPRGLLITAYPDAVPRRFPPTARAADQWAIYHLCKAPPRPEGHPSSAATLAFNSLAGLVLSAAFVGYFKRGYLAPIQQLLAGHPVSDAHAAGLEEWSRICSELRTHHETHGSGYIALLLASISTVQGCANTGPWAGALGRARASRAMAGGG